MFQLGQPNLHPTPAVQHCRQAGSVRASTAPVPTSPLSVIHRGLKIAGVREDLRLQEAILEPDEMSCRWDFASWELTAGRSDADLSQCRWNLENLLDEESAVALGRRTDKVFRAIKNDSAGWTPQLRDRKIEQLASVIAAMNRAQGPDLLGVCDVENRFVVDQLVDKVNATLSAPRSYAVVHADTDDARGIDVALIYDATLFQVPLPLEGSVFWPIAGAPDGSSYFDNQPNMLDQFLANKNMATGDVPIKVNPGRARIFKLQAMVNPAIYKERIPFSGMGKPANQNGFSDHFPITMAVTVVD